MSNYDSSNHSILQFAEKMDAGGSTRVGEGLLKNGAMQTPHAEFILDVSGDAPNAVENSAGQNMRAEFLASLEA